MMNSCLSFFSALLFLGYLTPSVEAADVPPAMYEFMGELIRLQPYMASQKAFSAPKSSEEIAKHLAALENISSRLKHSSRLQAPSLVISADAVQKHLSDLRETFHNGQKDYAFRMLRATMDGCASCHTQVTQKSGTPWQFKESELSGSDADRGEFLFTVRHYDEAVQVFNRFLSTPQKHRPGLAAEAMNSARKKLYIFLRAKKDPTSAEASLSSDLKSPLLGKGDKNLLQKWLEGVKILKTWKVDAASPAGVEKMAATYLVPLKEGKSRVEESTFVAWLYGSGLIAAVMSSPDAKPSAKLFYWMGVADREINRSLFFSFWENYFKECINGFPKTPDAQMCYKELKASYEEAFTGSSGTHLPADIEIQLKELKKSL